MSDNAERNWHFLVNDCGENADFNEFHQADKQAVLYAASRIKELEAEVKKWKLECCNWQDVNTKVEEENRQLRDELETGKKAYADLWANTAELVMQNGWVKVDDRLPDDCQNVIFWDGNMQGSSRKFGMYLAGTKAFEHRDAFYGLDEVTHWQPLPEPPRADDDS